MRTSKKKEEVCTGPSPPVWVGPGVSGVTVGKPHQGDGKPSLTRGLSLWKGRCPEVHAWPLSYQGWPRSRQPHT